MFMQQHLPAWVKQQGVAGLAGLAQERRNTFHGWHAVCQDVAAAFQGKATKAKLALLLLVS